LLSSLEEKREYVVYPLVVKGVDVSSMSQGGQVRVEPFLVFVVEAPQVKRRGRRQPTRQFKKIIFKLHDVFSFH